MQALSSYNPDKHSVIQPTLQALEEQYKLQGLTAGSYFSQRGLFARFVWPDWPEEISKKLAEKVATFHTQHHLLPIEKGSEDWNAVFRSWRSDGPSVSAIAEAFRNHFGKRLLWVESERDNRGRIAGRCMVERLGEITLHLFWRDSSAIPLGTVTDSDREAFQSSVKKIFEWAQQRIRPVLDALHDRLKDLYGDRFRELYVFGSYARPDAGIELPIDSDLDVAVILSDFDSAYKEIERIGQVTSDLSLEHGLVISLIPVRQADYEEGRTSFTRVISEYAIRVK